MKPALELIWSEGMLLSQQHMQQFSHWVAHYQDWAFRETQAFAYGLFAIAIDEGQLLNGILLVQHCRGFFKNGTRIDCQTPIKLAVTQAAPVYLYVHEDNAIQGLSGYDSMSSSFAYNALSVEITDDFDSNRKQTVSVKQRCYYLTQDADLAKQHLYIKLCHIKQDSHGGFLLSSEAYPPCLNCFCLPGFEKWLNALVYSCQSACRLFDNAVYQSQQHIAQSIRIFIADCRLAYYQKQWHPWQFYQSAYVLLAALGEVIEVDYQHDQLSRVFDYLSKKIKSTIKKRSPKQVCQIALKQQTQALYYSEHLNDVLNKGFQLYLHAALNPAEGRATLFCQQIKVTAVTDIESAIHAALPGLQLSLLSSPPPEFKSTGCVFRLASQGDIWKKIVLEKQLAVFVTNDFLHTDIQLIAREAV